MGESRFKEVTYSYKYRNIEEAREKDPAAAARIDGFWREVIAKAEAIGRARAEGAATK